MNKNTITVNMKNLLYRILLSWRFLLISGIIFALLGNCYGVFRDYKNAGKEVPGTASEILSVAKDKVENTKSGLSDVEIKEVENAIEMHRRYEHAYTVLQDYISESVVMQLDYDRVPECFLRYYVDEHFTVEYPQIQRHEYSSDIARAYAEILLDEETISQIADVCGLQQEYAREIVTAYSSQNYLCVDVIGLNSEQCDEIINILKKRVNQISKSGSFEFADYDISLVSDNFVIKKDDSVYDKQIKKINDINSVWNSMSKVDEGLNEDQIAYYKAQIDYLDLQEAEAAGDVSLVVNTEQPSGIDYIHAKLILVGFAGGICLAVVFVILNYIFKPVIRSKENLTEDLSQTVLGTVWSRNEKKKFLGFVDKWITKWFYGRETEFVFEKRLEMLCAGIRIAMEKEGLQSVYFSGVSDKNTEVVQLLKDNLKETYKVNNGECIVYDPASLKEFAESDIAVFVETAGDSGICEINRELDLAKQSKVKVLGFILLQ